MAQTAALFLKLNGSDVQGDSTVSSGGRANSIEVLSWSWAAEATLTAGGLSAGQRIMGEVKFVQRIDKSTPLLFQGFTNNSVVLGLFRFYRPNPSGDGSTEQFFTFLGEQGRITSLNNWLPDAINPATANMPTLVQFTMRFNKVTQTYENGGIIGVWDTNNQA
jgi:type VI secretion system secreted protein Hcp